MPDDDLIHDASPVIEDVPMVVALLDENTANRIAAGEVIERPSSVVKELVENALDAGATRIEVELEEGGKRRIVVRDNGCGMGREDAVLSLQRHATSKIRTSDDLFAIRTLGFRGEALPSIASVSDFYMVSKRPGDETATDLIVHGGDIESVGDAGAPDGTTITVENLFFNTPARLKFLKTTQTELNQSVDLIHRLILANPKIAFRLTHDGYEMVGYPGAPDPRHALATVWGRDVARDMVPFAYESPALAVRGWVSKPSVSRATRSSQAMFVNGRFVRSRTLLHAFDSAFKALMTTDRHPVLALFVEIAPELVDVNVHPAKTEVRFTRDGDVYSAVHRAVQNALLTGGLVPEVSVEPSLPLAPPVSVTRPEPVGLTPRRTAFSTFGGVDLTPTGTLTPFPSPNSRGGESSEEKGVTNGIATDGVSIDTAVTLPDSPPLELGEGKGVRAVPLDTPVAHNLFDTDTPLSSAERSLLTEADTPAFSEAPSYIGFDGYRIGRLRVLAQSRNTYIVAETDDAILLIDQHVAHERVLYEQMMNGVTEKAESWGVVAQHLALPQTLELGAREARVASERLEALAKAGFLLEPFGGETFVVRAVPAVIANKDYLGTIREIIDDMTQSSLSRRLLVPHESAVIMASCKMAVKKGDPLTHDEMTRLLSDLARMKNPFTCPHGRPILLALPHREMDRKFHRIGPH